MLKEKDYVAVDRVRSEPLSGQFSLTGNNTEKFRLFAPSMPPANPSIPQDREAYGILVRFGELWNRELLIGYQGMMIP
jgi:hypothetical protein